MVRYDLTSPLRFVCSYFQPRITMPAHSSTSPTSSDPLLGYVSPLASRNASPEMQAIWSPRRKFGLWRRLWLALASAEHELGLPITEEQLDDLRAHLDPTDDELASAAGHEQRLRHDVMAHIHALGEVAPIARPIVHLGATSQFINCNCELLLLGAGLELVCVKTARVIDALADFAVRRRDLPTLAFTHYQPAQPTTVGRRAAGWAYDLFLSLERLETTAASMRLRGVKGATGTQASFLALFAGDAAKVEQLDELVCTKIGALAGHAAGVGQASPPAIPRVGQASLPAIPRVRRFALTGQTYPRVIDAFILSDLASLAAVIHKICNDVRLLANRKELEEPFGAAQIGSSAMPYKRNPMRSERATGLARFVMSLAHNATDTAATQWLERTLDDSANRRLSLPESFLALDGCLDLLHNIAAGLVVHERMVSANLLAELPFLASENLMMAAVALGRDRQEVHEAIRRHSRLAGARIKDEALPNDLIDRLRDEPLLKGVDLDGELDPARYVGLAPQQVDRFVSEIVEPMRRRYAARLAPATEPAV